MRLLRLAGLPWVLVLACDDTGTTLLPPPPPPIADGLPAGCSPLRTAGGECLMPFPNAIDLRPDPTTATGYRVALDASTLPVVQVKNAPLDPTRWNMADGFSPAGSMLVYFPDRVDAASLVPQDDIAASTSPGAATVLVDMTTGQLVAHFSGVDENVRPSDRQAVIITPAARLSPNRRYAVAVTTAARTLDGGTPSSPPLFQPMLAGLAPQDARSQAELARMPAIVAALGAAGVPQERLVVAWDFVTGSDEALTSHVLSMRDQALGVVGPNGGDYTVASVEKDIDATTARLVQGTFTVPQFIDNADESKPDAELTFDASGAPQLVGSYQAPFTIVVPAVAATRGPLPIVVYGHGLFGDGATELGGAAGSYVQDFANLAGVVVVATDWIGLSSHENPLQQGNSGAMVDALLDFTDLPWVTDRLQQALVNTMVLERTMKSRIANDPALAIDGRPAADPTRVYYYGISLGGIMGMAFMGYDPDVAQGVLGCGGGFWSALFQRSSDWAPVGALVPASYPDKLDQSLLLQLAQMQFDYADPATVAPHVLQAPLAGVPKKQILLQMGLYDAEVSNVTTEMIARTAGLTLLSPAVTAPFGLPATPGPLASALTTWNVNGSPRPSDTNQTPTQDNIVHEAIRRIPQVEQQIETFWATGEVVDTCGGSPCVEPVPAGTPQPTSL